MRKKKKVRKNSKKSSPHPKAGRKPKLSLGRSTAAQLFPVVPRGMGPRSAGQSGDIQGLSGVQFANSESVEELVEEGQDFEAELVSGVEHVPDADAGEILAEKILTEEEIEEEPARPGKTERENLSR